MTTPQQAAIREFSIEVVQKLKQNGFQALWAGGCVRDMLLDKESKDYDVATNAKPDEVREVFGYKRTLAIGASFGVITVLGGKLRGQVEVATFRNDVGYSDGRRPDSVEFSSAEEDAQRRDFTINGIFFDPIEQRVLDFVGGQKDLKRGLVRSIGNPYRRFSEDKLRMLRAVRFTSTFGFQLQLSTSHAIHEFARHIHVVSAERIAAELRRMLADPNRAQAVEMLRNLTLLREIFPELNIVVGHVPRWCHTIRAMQSYGPPEFCGALAILLHGCSKASILQADVRKPIQPAAQICDRLKLSNDEIKTIQFVLRHEATMRDAQHVAWPKLQRLLIDPSADTVIAVGRAMALDQSDLSGIAYAESQKQLPPKILDPTPLLTGKDLIDDGLRPGPKFQSVLESTRDAQLLGELTTRDSALEYARSIWEKE